MQASATEKLFSYGTLRYESVQKSTFGRTLEGVPDALTGYTLSLVKITDAHVLEASKEDTHPILSATGNINDSVEGMVFDITHAELLQADAYEVADYKRAGVQLRSGLHAWVYVDAKG